MFLLKSCEIIYLKYCKTNENLIHSQFILFSSNGFDNQNEVIFYAPDETTDPSDYSCQHQPVLGFKNKEPFLYDTNELSFHSSSRGQNRLPDIVTQATLECFYST